MKNTAFCIYVFTSLLLLGCATSSLARYPNANYEPTDPNKIAVYNNFPPVNYEVIGEVGGEGAPLASWDSVTEKMRQQAALIGGHAIIIQTQESVYKGSLTSPGRIQGNTQTTYNLTTNKPRNFIGPIGSSASQSDYIYTPGTSTPMYRKHQRGIVIRYK